MLIAMTQRQTKSSLIEQTRKNSSRKSQSWNNQISIKREQCAWGDCVMVYINGAYNVWRTDSGCLHTLVRACGRRPPGLMMNALGSSEGKVPWLRDVLRPGDRATATTTTTTTTKNHY